MATAKARTNQNVMFIDSGGRCYSLPGHGFPSARGHGEPLSGRVKIGGGAVFKGVVAPSADEMVFLGTDAGYGFIAKASDLYTKNKAGKAALTVPKGTKVLMPQIVTDVESEWLAIATNTGYLLVISMAELPVLSKGKGLKLINIASDKYKSGEEYVKSVAVLGLESQLVVKAGKRERVLKGKELDHYLNERGRRGLKLPKGFQKVDRLLARND